MDLAFPLSPVGPVARFTVSKLSIYIIKDFINFSTGVNGVFVNFCKLLSKLPNFKKQFTIVYKWSVRKKSKGVKG